MILDIRSIWDDLEREAEAGHDPALRWIIMNVIMAILVDMGSNSFSRLGV
ncbi:MAG: hypothetical protein J3T61_10795 [Candidatus Brocadiales bacterium]|nr:hypothetical protein [Candidatus Bathyanammoxibius sp.]